MIMIANDTLTDPRCNVEACKRVGAASMVVVPLYQHGKTIGVLKVLSVRRSAFSDRDVQTLELMAGLIGGTLGHKLEVQRRIALEEQLRQMAQYDSLTGLPNRALFYDRLTQAIARSNSSNKLLAVMFMDLDKFKSVNDTYGHDAGDALLRTFADRVRKLIRESDTFARLGGDEFTLIAENLNDIHDAENIAAKINEAARREFDINGLKLQVGASIGIALSHGEKTEAADFLNLADKALYDVKRAGRNNFKVAQA